MKLAKRLLVFTLILAMLVSSAGAFAAEGSVLTMPASLLIIDAEAFYGSAALDTVILPEGLSEIRERAFAESSLKVISLPASLTYIADDALEGAAVETVIADEGTYAFDWAIEHGYLKYPMAQTVTSDVGLAVIGETVTWTVSGSGGKAPCRYTFLLYRDEALISETEASSDLTFSYEIDEPGSYALLSVMTDADGDTLETYSRSVNAGDAISLAFSESAAAALTGETASWRVESASLSQPLQYAFRLYRGDTLVHSTEYGADAAYSYTVTSSGEYTLVALAKDARGNTASITSDVLTVKTPLALTVGARPETANPGDTVVWTASGSGGKAPYRYAYRLYHGDELVQATDYGLTRTYSYTFESSGSYYLLVSMTDADGDAIAVRSDALAVSSQLSLTIASSSDLALSGETVTWTASAANGVEPFRYSFRLYSADGTLIDETSAGEAASYSHTFDEFGEYYVIARLTDGSGQTLEARSDTLSVKSFLSLAFTESPKSAKPGNTVTWTVEGSGGVAPFQYAFQVYQDDELVDSTAFGAENTYSHTFDEVGEYFVLGLMTDAGGDTVQVQSDVLSVHDFLTLTVTGDAVSAVPDDTVTWTAEGEGGTRPYQYAFQLYRDGELTDSTEVGPESAYAFTFVKAGDYYVLAQMTDEDGDTIEAKSEILSVLLEDLVLLDVDNPATNLSIIRAYTWTASAHGGEKPYQYYFQLKSGSTVLYTRNFSTKPTFSYTFFDAGSYTLSVQVMDALGTVTDAYTENFSVANSNVTITGVIRIYVDINPTTGAILNDKTGHFELQINNSNGTEFAFGDRVYKNPVFSYNPFSGNSSPGIVSVFDGDQILRSNSMLYTYSFNTTVAQLKDFLITKMQSTYMNNETKVETEEKTAYTIKSGPFQNYNINSSNCFTATATWCSWLGYDTLSNQITSNYKDYIAPAMYNKFGRYWTYVGELREN